MATRVILVFLCVLLVISGQVGDASSRSQGGTPPIVDLGRVVRGLYLWDSYSTAGHFQEFVKGWHLDSLIPKRGLRVGWVEQRQEMWLTIDPEDEQAREKLKDGFTVIVIPFVFRSKQEALTGVNIIRRAPFVESLSPGSFSGRPVGDLVWTSKKVDSTPDYSRPFEILFVKNKTVVYLVVTKPPLTKWKNPVNAVWVENVARLVAERI